MKSHVKTNVHWFTESSPNIHVHPSIGSKMTVAFSSDLHVAIDLTNCYAEQYPGTCACTAYTTTVLSSLSILMSIDFTLLFLNNTTSTIIRIRILTCHKYRCGLQYK